MIFPPRMGEGKRNDSAKLRFCPAGAIGHFWPKVSEDAREENQKRRFSTFASLKNRPENSGLLLRMHQRENIGEDFYSSPSMSDIVSDAPAGKQGRGSLLFFRALENRFSALVPKKRVQRHFERGAAAYH